MTRYVRVLSAFLVLQGAAGGVAKVATGRSDDLAHSVLHLVTGLVGWAAARQASDGNGTRAFALAFGVFYLALAFLGWLWPSPVRALHLQAADHLFHLAAGSATLVAGVATFGLSTAPGAGERQNVGEGPR